MFRCSHAALQGTLCSRYAVLHYACRGCMSGSWLAWPCFYFSPHIHEAYIDCVSEAFQRSYVWAMSHQTRVHMRLQAPPVLFLLLWWTLRWPEVITAANCSQVGEFDRTWQPQQRNITCKKKLLSIINTHLIINCDTNRKTWPLFPQCVQTWDSIAELSVVEFVIRITTINSLFSVLSHDEKALKA